MTFPFRCKMLRATILTCMTTLAAWSADARAAEVAVAAQTSPEAAADALRAAMAASKAASAARAVAEPPTARLVAGIDNAFYQDLGGAEGVRAIVADFVDIMLADARVAASFEGVDQDRLRDKLAEQFCVASGGPCTYTGKSMAEVHEDMKVNHRQFNATVEDLQRAMAQQGVSSRLQNRLLARLAPSRRDIVTK